MTIPTLSQTPARFPAPAAIAHAIAGFFERPIAAGLGVFTILVWLLPLALWAWRQAHRPARAA